LFFAQLLSLDAHVANGEDSFIGLCVRTVLFCTEVTFRRSTQYFPGFGPMVEITYNVHVQRRPLYYVIYVILPATIISFMSLLAFLLPSDSGEKIGLGMLISSKASTHVLGQSTA